MAQPKRRWSKARTGMKRSTWKLEEANLVKCGHCGALIMPHRVCKDCGYYDNKEIISKEA
jgi:large subunit ribosomal protein L32